MKNTLFCSLCFLLFIANVTAQNVFIPNANFKAKLVSNLLINTNADAEIQLSEAAAYSGSIVVPFSNISNLTGIASFTAIDSLICDNNNLSTLNLSANTALVYIQCSSNQLSSLNVSGLTSLKTLYCYLNQLTSLDLSTNSALQILNVAINQLSSLNLSTNTSLKNLGCANNQLTSLDVSNNTLLTNLKCSSNSISSFTVYNNPLITFLSCSNNQISFLDVSALAVLDDFDASNNNLYYLNIQNGNNLNFSDFDVTSNPNLSCVQVDDVSFMTTNYLSSIDATASYSVSCPACTISIPDSNFKAALLSNPLINTNANSEIECLEAITYTGSIAVPSFNIASLSGIEYFTGITALDCSDNQLGSLNVSSNSALISLICSQNQISNLNVSNPSLQIILCSTNLLSSLDLTGAAGLKEIICDNNLLSNLNVSANSLLTHLFVSNNQLNSIDVSGNLALEDLSFINNSISTIDLTANTLFTALDCSQNPLTSINLSANSQLTYLGCGNNPFLSSLNIQNGNNTNLAYFFANNNPLLTCIQVDDTAYMNASWSIAKDSIATFSNNCSCILPADAGQINGSISVSACTNQNGISYSIDTLANATNYLWTLPPLATIVGNPDSNVVTVNYSPYSTSGNITVSGMNVCGTGVSSTLAVNFYPIPVAEICFASIDSLTQKIRIDWQKPTETYIDGYVIYREVAGVFLPIDTVSNTVFSSFLDTGSHPEMQAEKYKIAVLDSCGNTGDISASFEHKTIRLYGSIQPGGITKLYWNDYVGITDSLRYFNLLRDPSGSGSFSDTLQQNIAPAAFMNFSDGTSAAFPNCRYVIEMIYNSTCTPSFRTLTGLSTTRSNIKNKIAFFDSTTVGINAASIEKFDFKIYPNPAKEFITIELTTPAKEGCLCISDLLDRKIIEKQLFEIKNSTTHFQLSIRAIESGAYFISFEDKSGKKHQQKLIIE